MAELIISERLKNYIQHNNSLDENLDIVINHYGSGIIQLKTGYPVADELFIPMVKILKEDNKKEFFISAFDFQRVGKDCINPRCPGLRTKGITINFEEKW